MNAILETAWQQAGFETPTEIQSKTFDLLAAGQSVLGLAPTGTGKTLAFSLPILQNMQANAGLQLIILVSSQELAHQMQAALQPFVKALGMSQVVVTGNTNVKRQMERLKAKPDLVIATVGRLMELLNKGKIKIKPLKAVILDEADALLFENGADKLQMIFDHLPKPLQVGFFGATTSRAVTDFAAANHIDFTTVDTRQKLVKTQKTEHLFLRANNNAKNVILKELSRQKSFYGMVFFRQKNQLIKVAHIMADWHVPVAILDGRKDSIQRQHALQSFRQHKINLLLATDVAARGLDIDNLTTVVNYDIPETETAYVHRSGRTGRMYKQGQVLTLGNDHDQRDLQKLLGTEVALKLVYLVDGQLTQERPSHREFKTTTGQSSRQAPGSGHGSRRTSEALKQSKKKQASRLKNRKNKGKPKHG
ncbi:MAG: DEAD/DEAH box helicase [Lactobacillus sp.]|jgi:superfamily II DNA/RNA helicase|nr:DEAD/DEAH box helicase [Lactobacillus sp.]